MKNISLLLLCILLFADSKAGYRDKPSQLITATETYQYAVAPAKALLLFDVVNSEKK